MTTATDNRTKPGDLEPLEGSRFNPYEPDRPWPWGPVVRIHGIGDLGIVEYRWDLSDTWGGDPDRHGSTAFSAYRRTDGGWVGRGHSHPSLDSALVDAIAWKRLGDPNTQAGLMFDRMTKVDR